MPRRLFLLLLLLMLARCMFAPGDALPVAHAQTAPLNRLNGTEEDPYAALSTPELIGGHPMYKSLPGLSRQEIIVWSFRTAAPAPFQ